MKKVLHTRQIEKHFCTTPLGGTRPF